MKKKKKESQEYEFNFNGTKYIIAKGGIHSEDKPRKIVPTENEILIDADIGGQYPWTIIKRELYPPHLGKEWLVGFKDNFDKRSVAKKEGKKSITEAFKLSNNGGGYGKLGEENNWQYAPECMYKCTIGNQVEILMLIEKLETNGIHVISANTDGILSLFNKEKLEEYYRLCSEWELHVGNSISGKLEFTQYKFIIQTSVNDYLAVKSSDEVKLKGDFVSDFELHKNKSARVVPLALQEYFINKIKPEDFIFNHTNIFDFCLCTKAKKGTKLITLDVASQQETELQRVNRYYMSTDGKTLLKRMPPVEDKKITRQLDIFGKVDDGVRESQIQAGYLSTIFNKIELKDDIKDYNLDYNYYLKRVYKIINQIEHD